jgi:uncharacterized membrane protein YoaK (UPF0700 family)
LTTETRHHASGSLGLAVTLAGAAGFVDAFIYLRVVPVFVANMSGNLVRLGMAAGQRDANTVAAALVALIGFSAGAAVATTLLDRSLQRSRSLSPAPLLVLESALLSVLAATLVLGNYTLSPSMRGVDVPIVVLGASAMGIQAVALRRVGRVAVSTTYGTGAVVRLSEKVTLAVRHAERPGDHRRRFTVAVLGTVLVCYILGAGVGASAGSSPAWLLVPIAISGCGALLVRNERRGTEGSTQHPSR